MPIAGEFKRPRKRRIVGGVDTHADTHHAAVVLMNGRRLADRQFPATAAGYADHVGGRDLRLPRLPAYTAEAGAAA